MAEWITIGVIVLIIYFVVLIFQAGKSTPPKKARGAAKKEPNVKTPQKPSGPHLTLNGDGWSAEVPFTDGALWLSPDVTLTMKGSPEGVKELVGTLINQRKKHFPEYASQLAMVIAKYNLEIPEIDEYRAKFLAKWNRAIDKHLKQNPPTEEDFEMSSEEEIRENAAEEVFEELPDRPSIWRSYKSFLVPKPAHLSSDDALLAMVDHDPTLLQFLLRVDQYGSRPQQASTAEELRLWRRLVGKRLAEDATTIPAEQLVQAYTVEQLKAACQPARAPRRKIEYAALLTDEARGRLPDLNKTFRAIPLSTEVKSSAEAFHWAYEVGALLGETFRTAYASFEAQAQAQMSGDEEFWIHGECCATSRKASEEGPKKVRTRYPPYHIGCTAELSPC